LLVLPGAWLAFGLPLRQLSFAARLALAGVLSPVLIGLEFYAVRLAGVSFTASVWALLLLNLGSLWFVVREWPGLHISLRPLAASVAAYLVLAGCAAFPWLVSDNVRIFTGHTWTQMSILYQFTGGALFPEEPELAGTRLAYPWQGHVYWAVLGWALDLSPTWLYVLTNLVWLVWVCVLFCEICRSLGTSAFGSRIALLWLGLGTNVAGSLIWSGINVFFGKDIGMTGLGIVGDIRATPWVRKFITFNSMPFAIGLFAAMILLSLWALRTRKAPWLVMVAILLAGVGLIYPILFPAALGFCGVLFLLIWWDGRLEPLQSGQRPLPVLFAGIIAAVLLTMLNVQLATGARSSAAFFFSGVPALLTKFASELLALVPFLIAIALLPRQKLIDRGAVLLLVGALPSLMLRPVFRLGVGNEYKFLFFTALCLAPVASLVLDEWVRGRFSRAFILMASVLLVVPAIPAIRTQQGMGGFAYAPEVNEKSFFIQLKPQEPETPWIERIRAHTPSDTVLLLRRSNLFLPAVTRRSLLAPMEQSGRMPGHWMSSRFNLVNVRGYSTKLIASRQALLRRVFECGQDCEPAEVESQLRNLKRPLAIVFSPGEGKRFLSWLEQDHRGRMLYRDSQGIVVWLLEP
jgi:hypothetical protein